jgi:hypothetical protein
LFENAPLSYQSLDKNANIIDVNPAWLSVLGYEKEEVIGRHFGDFMTSKSAQKIRTLFSKFLTAGKIHDYQFEMVKKDGTIINVSYDGKIGYDELGHFKQTHCIFTDITERKQAEIKLRDEKERLRNILDLVGDPIFIKDNDHRVTLANRAFYDMFGMDEGSVIGFTLAEAVPKNERKHFLAVDRKVLDTGIPDQREEELTIGNLTRTIITRKIRLINESKEKLLLCSIYDITERKQAEIKLLKDKVYFEELINALPGLFYQINNEGKFINWNKNFEILSGYSTKEFGRMEPVDLFEGDDKNHIAENITKVFIDGETEVEAEVVSKDGKKTPHYFTGKRVIIDEAPVLIGMGIDVSNLKKVESELKKHREQLEELVNERTKDLEAKNKILDDAMKVFVGRELTIRNLQATINALKGNEHSRDL